MKWLIVAGGVPGIFVLIFGLLALVAAAFQARRPQARRAEIARQLSRATLYSVGAGVASDLASVFLHVTGKEEWAHGPDLHLLVMLGIAESMAPAIIGFTLLSLTAMLLAIGARRAAPEG